VAAVAVGAAGGGGEQLAREGLVAGVADHGAQLPLVAQLRLQGTRTPPSPPPRHPSPCPLCPAIAIPSYEVKHRIRVTNIEFRIGLPN
jgi:hypothetical protein